MSLPIRCRYDNALREDHLVRKVWNTYIRVLTLVASLDVEKNGDSRWSKRYSAPWKRFALHGTSDL